MDAELVSAASDRLELKEGVDFVGFFEDFGDSVESDGRFAAGVNDKSGRALIISDNRQVDFRGVKFRAAFDDSEVGFMGVSILELATEVASSGFVFCENDNTGGVAVKAVDEKAVVLEGGFGREFTLSHTEEAGGFVDDENIVVFIDDAGFEVGWGFAVRDGQDDFGGFGVSGFSVGFRGFSVSFRGFGCGFRGFGAGRYDNFGIRFRDDFAVYGDVAGFDEVLESAAVKIGIFLD